MGGFDLRQKERQYSLCGSYLFFLFKRNEDVHCSSAQRPTGVQREGERTVGTDQLSAIGCKEHR